MKLKSGVLFMAAFLVFFILQPFCIFSETFEEYRDRTRREQAEQDRRREEQRDPGGDDEDGGWARCLGQCLGAMLQGMCEAAAEDSGDSSGDFTDSPQGDSRDVPATGDTTAPAPQGFKPWSIELVANGSILVNESDLFSGFSGQLNISLFYLHLNAYYGRLMDETGNGPEVMAFHVGLAIPLEDFRLAIFGGVYLQPYVNYAGFSFGAQMRAFFSPAVLWSLDGFCSIDGSLFFAHASTSIGFVFDQIIVGGGLELHDLNNLVLAGPQVNLRLWF